MKPPAAVIFLSLKQSAWEKIHLKILIIFTSFKRHCRKHRGTKFKQQFTLSKISVENDMCSMNNLFTKPCKRTFFLNNFI